MRTRPRRLPLWALMALLATLVALPSVAVAAAPTAASTWHHGSGTIDWRAGAMSYLYADGSRYAARGHAYMGEDDCWGWGMDGMRMTVRFQRYVDGHWITTQRASRRTGWSNMGSDMDSHHAKRFAPTFDLRHADRTHRTRMHYSFGWYDGHQALAHRHAVRYP